jgi:hypothetical protein
MLRSALPELRPRRILLAACLSWAVGMAIVPAGAQAAAYPPPPGKVYAGVTGGLQPSDYTSFASFVGKRPPVWQLFLTWSTGEGAMQYVRLRLQQSAGLRTRLMFHITTANKAGREVITPAGIASGAGDTYFLNLNRELGAANQIAYVRPMGEMNQAANVYSAYGHRGHRGKSHSQANFKRAWRRLTLILRGGNVAVINARLRASGMPPVRTSAASLPTPPVALMWCPQVSGNPGVAGNAARAYYPGSAYVDWICTDFYSGYPNFSGLNRFYSEFARTGKPFAFGEWGIYPGGDAPGFVRSLFRFVKSHPGVRMVLFNQGNRPGGRFRLQRYPRSAAALRSQLRDPRFVEQP